MWRLFQSRGRIAKTIGRSNHGAEQLKLMLCLYKIPAILLNLHSCPVTIIVKNITMALLHLLLLLVPAALAAPTSGESGEDYVHTLKNLDSGESGEDYEHTLKNLDSGEDYEHTLKNYDSSEEYEVD